MLVFELSGNTVTANALTPSKIYSTTGSYVNSNTLTTNPGQWYFGAYTSYDASLNGYLSNIQIYNTTLSVSEVQALYAEGIGGAPIVLQNLIGWWPLNGDTNDYSGNGNNGVPTNIIMNGTWTSRYTGP
jgi:hypothetical protein